MEEEIEIRAESGRIEAVKASRLNTLSDFVREARKAIDIELRNLQGSYEAKIAHEYKIDRQMLKEKKERARRR